MRKPGTFQRFICCLALLLALAACGDMVPVRPDRSGFSERVYGETGEAWETGETGETGTAAGSTRSMTRG